MSVHVIYLVEEVALGQVFLPALRLPPVSIIPLLLHTHLQRNTTVCQKDKRAKRQNGDENRAL